LRARGVTSGDRVAIVLEPGLAFAQVFHACLLLAAVAVPVDVRLSARERAPLCDGAAVVVEEPLAAAHGGGESRAGRPPAPTGEGHDLGAVAAVVHTSGTSSAPRPVELTYGNFLWSALGSAVALGRDPRERWLCALPVAHVGGLSILVRSAIYATTAVVHPSFEEEPALRALLERDITLVSVVATTLARLLDAGLRRPRALRCALAGGGPVPAALLERASAGGVPVALTYGLTEACSQVTTTPLGVPGERWGLAARDRGNPRGEPASACAGPPLFCTRVRTSFDQEILVRGPTVAPAALQRDGWLHTGDLGQLDSDGQLRVTGRKADTIVSGGENVAPAEVEAVLEQHPDVLEAAVVARADGRWGEAVTAIVVARPGHVIDREALRGHCARALAPYKVPKQILLSDGPLPRGRSGKLLRRRLQ
jgi:o-succinylbenzoate---CoA ligase